MEVSDPKISASWAKPRGEFFSRPLFRSGPFLLATLLSIANAALLLVITARNWSRLSYTQAFLLLAVAFMIGRMWWNARQHLQHVHDLFSNSFSADVVPHSPLDVTLGALTGVTLGLLYDSAVITLVLVLLIGFFLKHAL